MLLAERGGEGNFREGRELGGHFLLDVIFYAVCLFVCLFVLLLNLLFFFLILLS
jgi:hypothetical protein